MPSSDKKKDKKSKKQKQEEQEEQEQQEELEQVAEEPEQEEAPKKKKKKSKQQVEEEQQQTQESEEQAEEEKDNNNNHQEEDEEENELVIKNNKNKNKRTHSEAESSGVDESQLNKVFTRLDEVSEELVEQFRPAAERVVKKHKNDSIKPLAAAIAILTGATNVVSKSLLTQREGFTTYILTKHDDEIRGKSFGFVIIKRILGEEEGDRAVSHITFSKDRKSLVFDIPSSYDELIQEKWYSTQSLEMKPLGSGDSLPELEEGSSGGGGGGGRGGFGGGRGGRGGFGGGRGGFGDRGGRGGGRGGRGGFGDRGGRGGRGGFGGGRGGGGFNKGGNDHASNKKITFDNDD